jgi:hypothetical protein
MYALDNVKKFIKDNPDLVGDRAEGILARAEELSTEGVVMAGSIEDIMGDNMLSRIFSQAVMNDPKHIKIGLEAIGKIH